MELRQKTAADEIEQAGLFNVEVVNSENHLDLALADIDAAISAEKQRFNRVPAKLL